MNATLAQSMQTAARPSRKVSILDPDFLIFAAPLALLLDGLAYVFAFVDGGIIAAVVNIVFGWPLIVWMWIKGKRMDEAKEENATLSGAPPKQRGAARQARKARVPGKRASRRLMKRAIILYAGTAIPIVNFIPFWIIGLIMLLRES
jgi:hypothetical protein